MRSKGIQFYIDDYLSMLMFRDKMGEERTLDFEQVDYLFVRTNAYMHDEQDTFIDQFKSIHKIDDTPNEMDTALAKIYKVVQARNVLQTALTDEIDDEKEFLDLLSVKAEEHLIAFIS